MSGQKKVRVVIDKKGGFTLEALEGFSGSSCVEQTKEIEISLGGIEESSGVTDAYYNGDDDSTVVIKL